MFRIKSKIRGRREERNMRDEREEKRKQGRKKRGRKEGSGEDYGRRKEIYLKRKKGRT